MRIAVLAAGLTAPLSETVLAIQRAGMEALVFSWEEPAEELSSADGYVLFSPAAVVLAEASAHFLATLLKKQTALGKPILGLGYGGAKLLVESGLVPGLYNYLVGVRVVENAALKEESTETLIRLTDDYQYNAFTRGLTPREGLAFQSSSAAQFIIPAGLLAEVRAQGLNVFLFCDPDGRPLPGNSCAALSNKAGNVMALLAYPEKNAAGDALFLSLRAHLDSGYVERVEPLYYWPRK